MLGYKVAKHEDKRVLITLEIPEDALTNLGRKSVVVKNTASYRANKVKVLTIKDDKGKTYDTATSGFYEYKKLEYPKGQIVEEPDYDTNPVNVYSAGIHFFLEKRVAELYGLKKLENGLFQSWHENGLKLLEVMFVNGEEQGLRQTWHDNGKKAYEAMFVNGNIEGLAQTWHYNEQKWEERNYVNGVANGLSREWSCNGVKVLECNYVDGILEGPYLMWYENGQPFVEGMYVNGEKVGEYKVWCVDGKRVSDCYVSST